MKTNEKLKEKFTLIYGDTADCLASYLDAHGLPVEGVHDLIEYEDADDFAERNLYNYLFENDACPSWVESAVRELVRPESFVKACFAKANDMQDNICIRSPKGHLIVFMA